MKNVKFIVQPLIPSKGIVPKIIEEQFEYRRAGRMVPESTVAIFTVEEPLWYNRPITSDTLIKQETDGLYSINAPYFGATPDYKTGYNILLNVGSISGAIQLKLPDLERPLDKSKLINMPMMVVKNTLLELGVPDSDLTITRNDVLYKGKKFFGAEVIFRHNQCSIDFVLTLFYKDEEELFKRLTGKYALKRQITGIIEETNLFTKKQFIEALLKNFKTFIATL